MSTWTSRILKTSKTFIFGLIVLTVVWFLYRFVTRMISKAFGSKPASLQAPATDFSAGDAISYVPKPFSVTNVDSDKSIDAILSGQFGPTIVMFYADWCTHCKNMTDAFESAAVLSRVPFVRIQGQLAPVSSQKFGVTGYPTIFGISSIPSPPRRFASMRTKESLLEFANAMSPGLAAAGGQGAGGQGAGGQPFIGTAGPVATGGPAHADAAPVQHAPVQTGPTVATIPPSVTLTE